MNTIFDWLFGKRITTLPVEETVVELVQVTELTLSDKGVTLIIIDNEIDANERKMLRLRQKKADLLRELRDCECELKSYNTKQQKLYYSAARLQQVPDKLTREYSTCQMT